MQPLIVQPSRKKWLGYLALSLAFVAAGVWMIATEGSSLLAWECTVFFGCTALVFVRQLSDRRPRITIDEKGILDRTLRMGVIEWNDIDGAYLKRMPGATFICLQLRDAKKYTSRLSPRVQRVVALNEKLGATPVSLNLTGVEAKPQEVLDLIETQVRARWGARAGVAT